MMKKLLVAVLGLAALVLSPVAACSMFSERDPVFEFGGAEVRAAIEGTWTITVPAWEPGAPRVDYTVVITQGRGPVAQRSARPSLVAAATACSERSLVRSASACGDSTKVPLDVQIVNAPSSHGSRGELVVWGTRFHQGRLEATIDGLTLAAQISAGGTATKVSVLVDNDYRNATMVRVGAPAPAVAPAPKT
jgi:hypothetical protein